MEVLHRPVLLLETIDALAPQRGGDFVDGTLGMGGHAAAMLEAADTAGTSIRYIGFDRDTDALELAQQRLGERVEYVYAPFSRMEAELRARDVANVDGILLDLGVSSLQLDTGSRGFSFRQEGPLDMRMDQDSEDGVTAATIVNTWTEKNLADLLWQYGEERFSRQIAKAVVERRRKQRFEETLDLAAVVASAYPARMRHGKINPATRTFQALRIEVNRELDELRTALEQGLRLLSPGGVLAVITFHSLEDRIVKLRFREAEQEGFERVTKKPVAPSREEEVQNPRSRSAKLRAVRRI